MGSGPEPRRFATAAGFRTWLARNHAKQDELVLRCYKVHAAEQGITYQQALDEALGHGWIDGIRRSLDAVSFSVRFTPRRSRSIWSLVNVRRVEVLTLEGRMAAAGLAEYERRSASRTGIYSYEQAARAKPHRLAPAFVRRLRADRKAHAWFAAQPPWYRRICARYVMSAKQQATRLRRFESLLASSRKGERIGPLRRKPV